jgi:hypothetical protein
LTQLPPQFVSPGAQSWVQAPFTHTSPCAQAWKQAPHEVRLFAVSTQLRAHCW